MNNFIMDQMLVNVAMQGPMAPIAGRTREDAEALDFDTMLQQLRTVDGAEALTAPRAASKEDAEPETPTEETLITDEQYALAMALMFQPRPEVRYVAPEAETVEETVPARTVETIDAPEISSEAKTEAQGIQPVAAEVPKTAAEAPAFEHRTATRPQESPKAEPEMPERTLEVPFEARGAEAEAPAQTSGTLRVEARAPQVAIETPETGPSAAADLPRTIEVRTTETNALEEPVVETEAPQAAAEMPVTFTAQFAEAPKFETAESVAQPVVSQTAVARETPELVIEAAETPDAKETTAGPKIPTTQVEAPVEDTVIETPEAPRTAEAQNLPMQIAEQTDADAPERMTETAVIPTGNDAEPAEEPEAESQSKAPAEIKSDAQPQIHTEPRGENRVESRSEAPTEAKTETAGRPEPLKAGQPEERMPQAETETPRTERTAETTRTAKPAARTGDETEPKQTAEVPGTPVFTRIGTVPVKTAEVQHPIPLEAEDGVEQLGETIGDTLIYRIDEDHIEIKLAPETLGKLTVELERGTDGTLSIVLHAENERTNEILSKNMDGLRSALMSNTGREVQVQVQRSENSQQQFLDPNGENRQGREQQQQQQQHGRNAYRRHEAQEFLQQLRLGLVSVTGTD